MSSKEIQDPLLDHTYDGIQEFDNPLPGWWVMIFWASIIFCVPYTIYVHFMDGNTVLDKYEADMEAHKSDMPILNLTADAATILAERDNVEHRKLVEGTFVGTCGPCHAPDGTGRSALGPNLTDKHWKNVKKLPDIYDILHDGVPGTAMLPQGSLNQDQMVLMAAYVAYLSENYKEGLPPEGEELLTWPSETK